MGQAEYLLMAAFDSLFGFLKWLGWKGEAVEFGYSPDGKWKVVIAPGNNEGDSPTIKITSGFYEIVPGQYGNPIIKGACVSYGDNIVNGFVIFGLEDGKLKKINRRRAIANDKLDEGLAVIDVINPLPDRVSEPVAVVAKITDKEALADLNGDTWLDFAHTLRDGVERDALLALRKWAKST